MSEAAKDAFKDAVLIAGPTASGKSALAMEIARRTGGVIVNADSMQVYGGLSVLTARPGQEEVQAVPHRLYGHVPPLRSYSTGEWLRAVDELGKEVGKANRRVIFVGGTGLYFRALEGGLSDMPEIPAYIRDRLRYRLMEEGAPRLHRELMLADPDSAMVLAANDGQRIVRALEIMEATGRPIGWWRSRQGRSLVAAGGTVRIVISPDRSLLHERIGRRFDSMMAGGAVEEVRQLTSLRLDPSLPVMKAIGVREIAEALEGRITMNEAAERAKAATRQFAKRQETWFRNQLGPAWEKVQTPANPEMLDSLLRL